MVVPLVDVRRLGAEGPVSVVLEVVLPLAAIRGQHLRRRQARVAHVDELVERGVGIGAHHVARGVGERGDRRARAVGGDRGTIGDREGGRQARHLAEERRAPLGGAPRLPRAARFARAQTTASVAVMSPLATPWVSRSRSAAWSGDGPLPPTSSATSVATLVNRSNLVTEPTFAS